MGLQASRREGAGGAGIGGTPIIRSMIPGLSSSREEETLDAKARWYQSLPLRQRLDVWTEMIELLLAANPDLPRLKDVQHPSPTVRIVAIE